MKDDEKTSRPKTNRKGSWLANLSMSIYDRENVIIAKGLSSLQRRSAE